MDAAFREELRRAWAERVRRAKREEGARRRQAIARAEAAARFLKEKYGVEKVYLFGSLVWGKRFTSCSDIDLMVEGLRQPDRYWRMQVELEELTAPFEVNVVLAEDALPSLREKVRKEGRLL
ncbi:MAG: nucleotidyltransferase domain-containing protein [Bacillota bacterium]